MAGGRLQGYSWLGWRRQGIESVLKNVTIHDDSNTFAIDQYNKDFYSKDSKTCVSEILHATQQSRRETYLPTSKAYYVMFATYTTILNHNRTTFNNKHFIRQPEVEARW